jgi:hypothetical protein
MMERHITRVSEAREQAVDTTLHHVQGFSWNVRAGRCVLIDLFKLRHYLYDNAESNSILTLFREVSDVGLGYTPELRPTNRCQTVKLLTASQLGCLSVEVSDWIFRSTFVIVFAVLR